MYLSYIYGKNDTHLGPHNVRRIVDEKVDGQTRFVQRRATGEAQALEHFRGIDYGLAKC